MRSVLALLMMAAALSAQQQPDHPLPVKPKPKAGTPAAARTSAKTASTNQASAKQTAAAKSTTAKAHAVPSRRLVNGRWVTVARRPAGPPKLIGQQHPEPNRYQEIQKALQERGYFKGEPNGEWKDDSVEALKHFQADQKINSDGKINSLTLIGLGLGPKHDGGPLTPPPTSALPPATPPPINPTTVPPAGVALPNKPQ